MTEIRKRLITRNGNRFLLSGVPLNWVNNLPSGTVVFDPQITIEAPNHDVWIEYNKTSNYNSYAQLRIGRQTSWGWKRSLVKFDISTIPQGVTIQSADLKLYFYGTGGTRITRTIQCHQVLKDWTESGATWFNTGFGSWGTAGVGLDDIDAKLTPEDWKDWYDEFGWKIYNITNLTQKWVDGTDSNYGVIFWATNESQYSNKDEKRCRSSEYSDAAKHPKLVIDYEEEISSTQASITYYIRDAAGNVIGTYKKVIE